jgi:NAD(P)-dependent dehydrogenase (short-subunit alcohol dehydrogenase family)
MRLDGKVALITGAGSGMGRVAARLFAREGAKIVATDVDEAAGRETERLAQAEGLDVRFLRADVSKEADCQRMVAFTEETFGKLNVLYNNAGIFPEADRSVIDTEEAVWDRVLAVNVKGVYLACKYGIPAMQRAGGGSIVNIASFVALVGCSVPQDAYTASKGAVIAMTRSLAVQFAPQGIRTNAICPGPIETPLLTSWLLTDPEAKALRLARNPTGRFGQPEDIVYLAIYLASDESTWTNGAIISADGGITANYF